MTNWLADALLPVTITLGLLLVLRPWMLRKVGAQNTYLSWLLVPASLLLATLELNISPTEVIGLEQYAVISNTLSTGVADHFDLVAFAPIGSALLFGFLAFGHINSLRQLSRDQLKRIHLDQSFSRTVKVYQTSQHHSPMLIGLIRPKLLLPKRFFELYSGEQQELILNHELCHHQRKDLFWNLVAIVFLTIFWFHPLAWLAYIKYRQDQELSCDQSVLARKHKRSRISYCKALLAATDKTPTFAFAQLSFEPFGAKHNMLERIEQIKTESKPSKLAVTALLSSALVLLSTFTIADHYEQHKAVTKADKIHPLTRIEPVYPKLAVANQLEGSVVLKFDVTPTGKVQDISVVKSVPNDVFEQSAIAALNQWTYSSSQKGAKDNLIQLDFKLGPDSKLEDQVERIQVQGN